MSRISHTNILYWVMSETNGHSRNLSALKTKLTLRPGRRGTKQLQAQYGDRLACVRYRYDAQRHIRVKTVELIIEQTDWIPEPGKRAWNAIVDIRVEVTERTLQREVKAAGGKWNATKKVWKLPYHKVVKLNLHDRICA